MKTAKNQLNYSFIPFLTFIEYRKELLHLKDTLNIKKRSSVLEARKILDSYMKPPQKLSDDILKMREE